MYTLRDFGSKASPEGEDNCAEVAGPPLPVLPLRELPANRVTTVALPVALPGATEKLQMDCVLTCA